MRKYPLLVLKRSVLKLNMLKSSQKKVCGLLLHNLTADSTHEQIDNLIAYKRCMNHFTYIVKVLIPRTNSFPNAPTLTIKKPQLNCKSC